MITMKKFFAVASNLGGVTVKGNVVDTSAMKLLISRNPDRGYEYIKVDDNYIGNYDELFSNSRAFLG